MDGFETVPVTASPKRVLLAWEFGKGNGHAQRLAMIGRRLAAEGFETRYVFQNPAAAQVVGIHPSQVTQSPRWPEPDLSRWTPGHQKREATRTLGQTLGVAGFGDAATVLRVAGEWEELVEAIRPDLVIADYAPSAVMAFRGRVPVIMVGSGYSVPPADADVFLPFHNWTDKQLFAEDELLANVNAAQLRLGRKPLDFFVRTMQGDRNLVCTWRLLDPLARVRREPQIGPVEPKIPRPDGRKRDLVFAYFHPDLLSRQEIMELLCNLPKPALAVVPGIPPGARRTIVASGAEVSESLADMADLLPRCRAVAHLAGVGVASMALAAGTPQLGLTTHIDSLWTGHAVQWAGAGLSPRLDSSEDFAKMLRRLIEEPSFAAAALRLATEIAAQYPQSALDTIVAACRGSVGIAG